MSKKRLKARARALRAAQVVTIAGAMLVGCNVSHELPLDAMVMPDGDLRDGELPDADLPDRIDSDADLPDDRVVDADIPDSDANACNFIGCGCVETTRTCCDEANEASYAEFYPNSEGDPTKGQCCGVCAGPFAPPELMVG